MSFDEIHEGKHYGVLLRNQDGWFKEASPFPHGVIASDYPRTQSSDRDQEIMRSFGKCVGWKVLSCLSWNWRERSSVKITERTHAKRAEALHCRREGWHPKTAFAG